MFGITLSQLKVYAGYAVDDTSRDAILTIYLNAAIESLKKFTGRNLEYGKYRDTVQSRSSRVFLRESPVTEVTAFTSGLTNVAVAPTEYELFKTDGLVQFPESCCWPNSWSGSDFTKIDYIGGYRSLPADMLLAVFNAVLKNDTANKRNVSLGGVIKRVMVYDVGSTDYYIPNTGVVETTAAVFADEIAHYSMEASGMLAGHLTHATELIELVTS